MYKPNDMPLSHGVYLHVQIYIGHDKMKWKEAIKLATVNQSNIGYLI